MLGDERFQFTEAVSAERFRMTDHHQFLFVKQQMLFSGTVEQSGIVTIHRNSVVGVTAEQGSALTRSRYGLSVTEWFMLVGPHAAQ